MTQAANSPAAATKEAGEQVPERLRPKTTGIPKDPGWYVVGLRSVDGQVPPRASVTFGGISFPEYAYDENPTVKEDTIEFNQRRRGQRIWLDKEDLEAITAAMGKKIVRVRSAKSGKCAILSADGATKHQRPERPMKGDLPLERFLYIEPSEAPEVALERGEEAPASIG